MDQVKTMTQRSQDKSQIRTRGFSVIIPAFNEAQGIQTVVSGLMSVLSSQDSQNEVIVVDDGSTDETAEIAKSCEGVKVISHGVNRGYGAAIKTGIRNACFSVICILDADGTYPVERILDLVDPALMFEYDMVVGWREGKHAAIPIIRRPAKWFIRRLAKIIVGEQVPDLNSGFRVFTKSAISKFINLLPDGFSFTTTITLGMLTNGYSVKYIPIEYHPRIGKSKIRPIKDTLNFIMLVLRIALYFRPMRIFIPMSVLLMLAAVLWGAISAFFLGRLADVSTSVLVLAAVQAAVVGLLADLINKRFPTHYKEGDDANFPED
jgi:glycosyltransferase involved in cell wall biosynthesis